MPEAQCLKPLEEENENLRRLLVESVMEASKLEEQRIGNS